jgi:putative redox protein
MPSQRVTFDNESGIRLAGIIDSPETEPVAYAVFAHCFTCSKDLKAIVKISRQLAKRNISVLRFDFAGIGNSGGKFSDSNFESNISDLTAAVKWLSETHAAPQIIIGHSLGGAAAMATLAQLNSVRCLATLASPSCTKHLAEFLSSQNADIENLGQGPVSIGGRDHIISTQMLDSFRNFDLESSIRNIALPHLIFHSPADKTVKYAHAENLFQWTQGPSTLLTLPGSDHLFLNQKQDANWVANCIAVWASRFID